MVWRRVVLLNCQCVCRRHLSTACTTAATQNVTTVLPSSIRNDQQLSTACTTAATQNASTVPPSSIPSNNQQVKCPFTGGTSEPITTEGIDHPLCPLRSGRHTELDVPHSEHLESHSDNVLPYESIPGPIGLPLIGNGLKYSALGPYQFEKILDNRLAYRRKYGPIYRERLGDKKMVHIFNPSDIAKMFRLEGHYPSRGKIAQLEITYLQRNKKLMGFAFLDGPEWARQRGIMQKVMMHPTAATRYLHMQTPVVQDFVSYLHSKRDANGQIKDLYEDLMKYTMEAIGVVCFNERLGIFSGDLDPACDAGRLSSAIAETFYCFRNCMFAVPWYKYFRTPMYRRFEKACNEMREIMGKHVQKVANKVRQSDEQLIAEDGLCPFTVSKLYEDRSMFQVLMQDDRISTELVVNLIMALFRTGIDSTGNALAFFLYNLASNPDKQQLLWDEISSVLPRGEPLTVEAIPKMSYLKAALRESFRLHFPVFGGSGRVMPEDVVFSGYNVPKGVFIFANMAATSRMEEYFPRPLEFHPERWLRDERARYQTTCTEDQGFLSLPFSAGMRSCPGKRFAEQGLYLAAVNILQKFELSYSGEEIGMIHMPFTVPDKPLSITFTPR